VQPLLAWLDALVDLRFELIRKLKDDHIVENK
jgi:hypothetical protein